MVRQVGQHLGPYWLMGQLGEGGMSVVHLALDAHRRPVAVKVLKPHVAGDADGRARFGREVRTLQHVRGRFVAEVLDAAVDSDPPYLVTAYVPGRPLDDIIRDEGPLTVPALARLGAGLAEALAVIHEAGIVHRDLKPGNVLMVEDDPTVIDFGIAQLADDARLTSAGLFVGTPGFLAPEVLLGEPAGAAADIHAWGATMAYAATGRPPFGSGPIEVVMWNIRSGLMDLAGLPSALGPVVTAALAQRPEDRPGAVDLVEWCTDLATYHGAWAGDAAVDAYRDTTVLGGHRGADSTDPTSVVPRARSAGSAASRTLNHRPAPPEQPPPYPMLTPTSSGGDPPDARTLLGPLPGDVDAAPQPDGRQHHPVVALALLCWTASLAAVIPTVTLIAVGCALLALRVADAAAGAHTARRSRHGVRRGDVARVAATLPWHAARGTASTAWRLPVPLLVGVVIAVPVAWIAEQTWPGVGLRAGAVTFLLVAVALSWSGRRGLALRRASSSVLDRAAPGRGAAVVLVLVLGALAAGTAAVALLESPMWWPLPAPPTELLPDDLIPG